MWLLALLASYDFVHDLIASIPFLWSLATDYYVFLYQERALERKLDDSF